MASPGIVRKRGIEIYGQGGMWGNMWRGDEEWMWRVILPITRLPSVFISIVRITSQITYSCIILTYPIYHLNRHVNSLVNISIYSPFPAFVPNFQPQCISCGMAKIVFVPEYHVGVVIRQQHTNRGTRTEAHEQRHTNRARRRKI